MKKSWPAIALTLAATAMFAPATHAANAKVIVGATLVNIDGGAPIENAVVVIDGERITAIGPAARTQVPAGAEVIQMPGTWLIPGLMNMHVHFGLKLNISALRNVVMIMKGGAVYRNESAGSVASGP